LPEARESGGGAHSAGQILQFFIKIMHFYAYLGQNSYFKASIKHQLKVLKISLNVLNRINEVQVLQYSYKCN